MPRDVIVLIVLCIYFIDTVTYDDVVVPAQPQEVTLVGSTEDSITIEWQQDGFSTNITLKLTMLNIQVLLYHQ
jgi:hypothetical protein